MYIYVYIYTYIYVCVYVCVCVCARARARGYMFQQLDGYPQDVKGRKKKNQKLQMHISVRVKLRSKYLILQNTTTPKKEILAWPHNWCLKLSFWFLCVHKRPKDNMWWFKYVVVCLYNIMQLVVLTVFNNYSVIYATKWVPNIEIKLSP